MCNEDICYCWGYDDGVCRCPDYSYRGGCECMICPDCGEEYGHRGSCGCY